MVPLFQRESPRRSALVLSESQLASYIALLLLLHPLNFISVLLSSLNPLIISSSPPNPVADRLNDLHRPSAPQDKPRTRFPDLV